MHVPDGFLDVRTSVAGAALSAAAVSAALRGVKATMRQSDVPVMGMTAAFIFAAQMVNFPVAAGTSGHLIGATLAAVLLGPWAAIVVMTAVLVVQCLLFADGGLLALGANVFNMAVVGSGAGYLLYALIRRMLRGAAGQSIAAGAGAWGSTVLAAASCAGELSWSGIAPWHAVFTAMVNVHMLIGIGEAVITVLVLSAVRSVRPDLAAEHAGPHRGAPSPTGRGLLLGGIIATGLLLFVAPFASTAPDGLEWAAARIGFDRAALASPIINVPMPDYGVAGMGAWGTVLAGAVGVIVLVAATYGIVRLTLRPKPVPPGGATR
jgi:cobalt/nickel transport system permease protein